MEQIKCRVLTNYHGVAGQVLEEALLAIAFHVKVEGFGGQNPCRQGKEGEQRAEARHGRT